MAAYAYLFLAASKEQLVSLADQQQAIGACAERLGLIVDEVIVEEGQALRTPFGERPQGSRLLATLQAKDRLVVMRTEWVFASAKDGVRLLDDLRRRQVGLYCVDLDEEISLPAARRLAISDGCSGLVRRLLTALAAGEGSGYGDAIKAAKRLRKRQGKYVGGPVPFGWRVGADGALGRDEQQQRVIAAMRGWREAGRSYREIAALLAEDWGVKLSHEGVRRILAGDRVRKANLRSSG